MGCSSSAQACTLAKSRVSLEKKQDRNDSPFSMISPAKGSENTGGGGGCACCSCWFYISAVKTEVMRSVGIASAFCRSRRRWSAKERSAEETICEGTIGTGGATRDHGFPRRPDHIAAIGNVFSGVRDHRQSFQFSTLHRDVVSEWKAAIRQDSSSTAQNVVVVATWLHGNWYLTNLFWADLSHFDRPEHESSHNDPLALIAKPHAKSSIGCPRTAKDNQGARIHDSWSLITRQLFKHVDVDWTEVMMLTRKSWGKDPMVQSLFAPTRRLGNDFDKSRWYTLHATARPQSRRGPESDHIKS